MRRAVPQRYGTDRLQGGELEVPAGPPEIEADARTRRAAGRGGPDSARRGPAEALRGDLLAGRVDEAVREEDTVQVRLGAGQPVEQVEAAVDQVGGVFPALGEELPRGIVQARQAPGAALRGRPGQEAVRVYPGVEPTAGKQQ